MTSTLTVLVESTTEHDESMDCAQQDKRLRTTRQRLDRENGTAMRRGRRRKARKYYKWSKHYINVSNGFDRIPERTSLRTNTPRPTIRRHTPAAVGAPQCPNTAPHGRTRARSRAAMGSCRVREMINGLIDTH